MWEDPEFQQKPLKADQGAEGKHTSPDSIQNGGQKRRSIQALLGC